MQIDASFYDMLKRQDQEEIDKGYGAGKYVRVPSGSIVESNEANRQAILQFESK